MNNILSEIRFVEAFCIAVLAVSFDDNNDDDDDGDEKDGGCDDD